MKGEALFKHLLLLARGAENLESVQALDLRSSLESAENELAGLPHVLGLFD